MTLQDKKIIRIFPDGGGVMDRLTKRDEYGNADIIGVESEDLQLNLKFEELNKVADALNKLAHYEDLAEQGRLVELPCRVGDTVFKIIGDKIIEMRAVAIPLLISSVGAHLSVTAQNFREACLTLELSDFGKTVFITRKEAEAKLAEKGGTNDE